MNTISDERGAQIERLKQSLLTMDRIGAEEQVREALVITRPLPLVEELIAPALEAIGEGWEYGKVALSQVYMSSRIAEDLVGKVLHPEGRLRVPQPSMAIVVLEDYHMLGKRIVHSVLRAGGYEVDDLGQKDLASLIDYLEQNSVQLLFVSTLMLRAALRIKDLKSELTSRGINTKVIAGGAPFRFDPKLIVDVDADASANSAAELMPLVGQLIKELS